MSKQQTGTTLIFTLIILTVILFSSLAMYRSSESNTVVAGNIAFKQSATASGDIGVTLSIDTLTAVDDPETTVVNQYYAVQQPTDNYGIPTTVDWDQVPSTMIGNNQVQHVIERLCTGALPIADTSSQCYTAGAAQISSKKIGSTALANNAIFFRVTVRVTGPKNTMSFIQSILRQS